MIRTDLKENEKHLVKKLYKKQSCIFIFINFIKLSKIIFAISFASKQKKCKIIRIIGLSLHYGSFGIYLHDVKRDIVSPEIIL